MDVDLRRVPDLDSLQLLVRVAELGSLSRAGRAHGIGQPAASARVLGMERRMGTALVQRSARGSILTPAGALVVGIIGAIGGGMLRDIIMNLPISFLQVGTLYAVAAGAGAGTLILLAALGTSIPVAALVCVVVTRPRRFGSPRFRLTHHSYSTSIASSSLPRLCKSNPKHS